MKKHIDLTIFLITAVFVLIAFVIGCRKEEMQASDNLRKEEIKSEEPRMFEVEKIPKYEPGVVLYKMKKGAMNRRVNAEHVRTKTMERYNDNGFYKLKVASVEQSVAELQAQPDVEWASPNWSERVLDFQPNDPYYTGGNMYGLTNIKANVEWNSGNVGKEDVYVVVIDEGSMFWHCDLNGKIWENKEEMNGAPGVDDDNNGYIDDIRGWNWYDGNNQLYMANDDHGTHVAGTIAAKGNNGIGVIGVAPNVKVISLKFLADWGYDSEAIKAIDYAIDLKFRKGLNIKIMSNSWGGGGFTQGLVDAIDRAKAADILFVCAAGNSNNNNDSDPSPSYPASYTNENIISVGASDWVNNKASFSSYGKTTVDLFAPGVNIYSTLPSSTHTSTYGAYSGTSMATPHVSGGLALLASVHPEYTWSQLKSTLLSTVTPVTGLSTYCVTGGVLNVSTFTGVTTPVVPDATCGTPPPMDMTPPPTPQNLRVIETGIADPNYGNYIKLQWDTTGFYNPLTYMYDIWMKQGSGAFWHIGGVGGNWRAIISGLQLDSYGFYIVASSRWGVKSAPSNQVFYSFLTNPPPSDSISPSTPQNVRATEVTTTSFLGSWSASTDNYGMRDYKVHWRPKGRDYWAMTFSTATLYRPTNLISDTTYEFFVLARDLFDNLSDTSEIIQVTTDVPPPPPPADNITPVVTITSPADGYSIPSKGNRNVKISFTATDNVAVTSTQILIDNSVVASNVTTYTWNSNKAAKGSHTITCKAFDAAGNQTSESVTVIKN